MISFMGRADAMPKWMIAYLDNNGRPSDCHPDFFDDIREARREAYAFMVANLRWAFGYYLYEVVEDE